MTDFEDVKKVLERGWIKGKFEAEDGCCLEGAIYRATGIFLLEEEGDVYVESPKLQESYGEFARLTKVVGKVIAEQYPDRQSNRAWPSIPMFNDAPETTLEDVLLVVDKAQRILEEQA
jgi:hypothetical protein